MPDVTYTINYDAQIAKAERGIDRLLAKILQLDVAVARSSAKWSQAWTNTQGITKAIAGMKRLETGATSAEKAVAAVGRGGNASAAATRFDKLAGSLKNVHKEAESAGPVVEGVGAGAGGGGGKPAKAGGGGILGATVRRTAAYAGYRALRAVGGAAGDATADRREFFRGATKVAVDYEKDLKELAVLQGKSAVDDDLIRSDLAFQKQTLLAPDQASTYRLEFGGAISPALKAVGKDGKANITPEVAKDLEVKAAQLTARYGLDPTTGGRMAGLLGVTHKVPTAESGLQTIAKSMELLNVEGVGPVSGMATALMSLSGSMIEEGGGGRFKNYPEMAARLAASTVAESGSSARAKTRIEQSSRLLRKFNEKGKGEFEGHGEAEFLALAGVTADDDYESAIRKVEPLLRDESGGLGKADTILAGYGFGNSTERKALIQEMGVNEIARKSLADPNLDAKAARAGAMNEEYRASGPGQRQAAEIEDFSATVEAGMAGRALETARMNTRTGMIKDDTLKAGPIGYLADKGISAFLSAGGISGEELRVDQQMIGGLAEEGAKYGVDVLGQFPGLDISSRLGNQSDEAALAKNVAGATQAIEAARKKFAQKLREAANAADAIPAEGGNNRPGAPAVQAGRR